jgi:hypothetical protein
MGPAASCVQVCVGDSAAAARVVLCGACAAVVAEPLQRDTPATCASCATYGTRCGTCTGAIIGTTVLSSGRATQLWAVGSAAACVWVRGACCICSRRELGMVALQLCNCSGGLRPRAAVHVPCAAAAIKGQRKYALRIVVS